MKKRIFVLCLAICILFAMSSVCASDVDDTAVASQDTMAEVDQNDDLATADEIGQTDDGKMLSAGKDVETLSAENDLNILGANSTFSQLISEISGGGNINLKYDYYTYDSGETIEINKDNTVINGNGAIIDMAGSDIRAFKIYGNNVKIKNLTIKNADVGSDGGAIYWKGYSGSISDSNFINNNVKVGWSTVHWGGAICWDGADGSISGCNFINNTADSDAGAIYWYGNGGRISDSNFINNRASSRGGAILQNGASGRVDNCVFLNNAASEGNAIHANLEFIVSNCWFGNNANNYNESLPISGECYCNSSLFLNATATPDTISLYDTSDIIFKLYLYESGQVSEYNNDPFMDLDLLITATSGSAKNTAKFGEIIKYNATNWGTGKVTASIEDAKYTIEINNLGSNPDLSVASQEADYGNSTTISLNYNASATGTINITLKGKNGNKYTFTNIALNTAVMLPEIINPDEYEVNVIYSGDDLFSNATATGTLTINKIKTEINANAIVTTYNVNKNLVITLKDAKGDALSNFNIIVRLDGTKIYSTDKNGQVIINVAKVIPKTYTAKITFKGSSIYAASSANVKVTVKKAKSNIVAQKKTFKKAIKVKKYAITLKSGKTKIGNAKVTLKIKGKKAITAKTNKMGKATFKIKNLNKKGTYKSTIKFNGNAYYIKATKKAIITIK